MNASSCLCEKWREGGYKNMVQDVLHHTFRYRGAFNFWYESTLAAVSPCGSNLDALKCFDNARTAQTSGSQNFLTLGVTQNISNNLTLAAPNARVLPNRPFVRTMLPRTGDDMRKNSSQISKAYNWSEKCLMTATHSLHRIYTSD